MKLINVIGFAILLKKIVIAVLISVWYAFSKLADNLITFLAAAIITFFKEK
jgi:hypothetical protein